MENALDVYRRAFALVVGHEGGFTADERDPGNWTGGRTGAGVLRGTKYGISAAAYPQLDVASITLEKAFEIYHADYWRPIGGDDLPGPLSLLLFDAAVNCGVGRAVKWLQQSVDESPDGVMGPATLGAISRAAQKLGGGASLCSEFQARRLIFMASLPTWRTFGLGWARRLFKLPYESLAGSA